jgi:methionine synthase II (cobalamin-independent)
MTSFRFIATGIGSVPFTDIEGTCNDIIKKVPHAPYWPQFVKRSHLEDMSIQYSERLPMLEIVEEKRSLRISESKDKEAELVKFYDHFLAGDTDYFAISNRYAPGLFNLIDRFKNGDISPAHYVKGQTVGPVTFAAGITDINEKMVLHNAELFEALVGGLAIKALWQVQQLEKTGAGTILFVDEPYLSGFGSAFSPIQRDEVIKALKTVIDYVKADSNTLVGIHCCGNTDWSMLLESGPDIINFDTFGYLEHFFLYPKEIVGFIERGGTIAWGVVPTAGFTGDETPDSLYDLLSEGLDRLKGLGIDPDLIAERSILTPACGMGTMEPRAAQKVLTLLSELSKRCREEVSN